MKVSWFHFKFRQVRVMGLSFFFFFAILVVLSLAVSWTEIKFCSYIHGPQRMNPKSSIHCHEVVLFVFQ